MQQMQEFLYFIQNNRLTILIIKIREIEEYSPWERIPSVASRYALKINFSRKETIFIFFKNLKN